MKEWICYNVLGENPETITPFSFWCGLALVSILTSAALFPVLFPIVYFTLG